MPYATGGWWGLQKLFVGQVSDLGKPETKGEKTRLFGKPYEWSKQPAFSSEKKKAGQITAWHAKISKIFNGMFSQEEVNNIYIRFTSKMAGDKSYESLKDPMEDIVKDINHIPITHQGEIRSAIEHTNRLMKSFRDKREFMKNSIIESFECPSLSSLSPNEWNVKTKRFKKQITSFIDKYVKECKDLRNELKTEVEKDLYALLPILLFPVEGRHRIETDLQKEIDKGSSFDKNEALRMLSGLDTHMQTAIRNLDKTIDTIEPLNSKRGDFCKTLSQHIQVGEQVGEQVEGN